GRPALEQVIHGLGSIGVAREPGTFGAHPFFELTDERRDTSFARRQTLAGRHTVDLALDCEDRVDAAYGFERQRRLRGIGQHEEVAPAVAPTGCFGDRRGPALCLVELSEPGIGIGLQDAGISGEVMCGVFTLAIARVEEYRCWRSRAGEGSIIAHIRPYPAGDRFAFGQDRHRRVVTMDTLGGE